MNVIKHTNHKIKNNCYSEAGTIIFSLPPSKRMVSYNDPDNIREDLDYFFNEDEQDNLTPGKEILKSFVSLPEIVFRIEYFKTKKELNFLEQKKVKKDSFILNKIYIAFSSNGKLYKVPFCNVYTDGAVCLKNPNYNLNFEDFVKSCISCFWGTVFTHDLYQNYLDYKNHNKNEDDRMTLSHYQSWETKTKENPEWIPDDEYLLNLDETFQEIFK